MLRIILLSGLGFLAVSGTALAQEPPDSYRLRPHMLDYQPLSQKHTKSHKQRAVRGDAQIVAHPAGCPSRAFCGCGVSVRAFGHPVRELYLAANYRRFPPAPLAAGMVAYRSHHVVYIEVPHPDGTATVYDPNSGGHLTRIHTISLAGYRIVNPHARQMAAR